MKNAHATALIIAKKNSQRSGGWKKELFFLSNQINYLLKKLLSPPPEHNVPRSARDTRRTKPQNPTGIFATFTSIFNAGRVSGFGVASAPTV